MEMMHTNNSFERLGQKRGEGGRGVDWRSCFSFQMREIEESLNVCVLDHPE